MFKRGQQVRLLKQHSDCAVNTYQVVLLERGDVGTITRANRRSSLVRRNGLSVWVPNSYLEPVGMDTAGRQWGQTPEGDHISVNDPRLDWLWRDIASYADEQGYCREFDKMCDHLGIPGRERAFKVVLVVNGFEFTGTVQARSQAEAESKVHDQIQS